MLLGLAIAAPAVFAESAKSNDAASTTEDDSKVIKKKKKAAKRSFKRENDTAPAPSTLENALSPEPNVPGDDTNAPARGNGDRPGTD